MLDERQIKLECEAAADGVDLLLTATNHTDTAWPELSAILPCLTPGSPDPAHPDPPINVLFRDEEQVRTYFMGAEGLEVFGNSDLHFNHRLRSRVDAVLQAGGVEPGKLPTWRFPRSEGSKWPISPRDAHAGLMLRESDDGLWVAGIAWEDFLSASGHYPLRCMHLSPRLGPLAPGETKTVRGKIYLFKGNREDCL